jgi:hypothetical protein
MALVVGSNSWQTVAEADLYLTDRLGAQNWFKLSDTSGVGEPSKEVYLIMAFNLLVNHPGFNLNETMTDASVKKAQSELALYFVDNYFSFIQQSNLISQGLKSFTMSKWKQDFDTNWQGNYPLPVWVSSYLTKYGSANDTVFLEVE